MSKSKFIDRFCKVLKNTKSETTTLARKIPRANLGG